MKDQSPYPGWIPFSIADRGFRQESKRADTLGP
jgi:hypothetical protein